MPRTAREIAGGICYHVINRGNAKACVYHSDRDYESFVVLMERACNRTPMRVLAYCLMPNHFHFVLWPHGDADLSRWMHWLLTTHVRHHHVRYETTGRVWQDRFKAFPIQQDEHLLTVLRYVERNPLRAGLVMRAEDWSWSSLKQTGTASHFVNAGPLRRPTDWLSYVNRPQTATEVDAMRLCVRRSAPFGQDTWVRRTATRLGLESSLRPRGRPKR